jgi:uncharacterized protein YegP (UPF0339 family)
MPQYLVKTKAKFPTGKRVWWFQLVGANGEPQCTSEEYTTKDSLVRGIDDHRRNAATEVVVWPS